MNLTLLIATLVTAAGALGAVVSSILFSLYRRRDALKIVSSWIGSRRDSKVTVTVRRGDRTINITAANSDQVLDVLKKFLDDEPPSTNKIIDGGNASGS
jgi:hypothetical protein